MIRILNTKQIRELDAFTIREEGIPSIDLMERACHAFVDWFVQQVDATKKIAIVCGTGNNGGDGLGIARLLKEWGYPVKVFVVRGTVSESADFKINLDRLQDKIEVIDINTNCEAEIFSGNDVIIDAIFGSGLSHPPEGIYAEVIRCINESSALRISVDIPSGLSADEPSSGEIVKAHYTLTFQLPKFSFFLPQSYQYTGEWKTTDIGLNKEFIKSCSVNAFAITRKDIRRILKPRLKFDHKGKYGHALIVGGSFGKMGAAVLASRAALRSGAGLVTTHIPRCGYEIIQTALPEAMVSVDKDENYFTTVPEALEQYTTMGIGPGMGKEMQTAAAIRTLLSDYKKPVVIDADGLNLLALHSDLKDLIPENSVLTPHPKEFERLVGSWKNDFERIEKQKSLAARLKSVVLVKGAYSTIATPDGNIFFNTTGNPGMAKGGSGDVLTGIITGLLSQGYIASEATIAGVFLHGLAGDLSVLEKGNYSLMATDLVEFLPQSFKTVQN